jgi:hypothetical protein
MPQEGVMTEGEWEYCSDPDRMLAHLREIGRVSPRKLRLFAAACCRRAWDLLDKHGRKAVLAAEQFADGLIGPGDVRRANHRARREYRKGMVVAGACAAQLATAQEDPAAGVAWIAGARAWQALQRAAGDLHWGMVGVGPSGPWLMRWRMARGKADKPLDRERAARGRSASDDAWWEERRAQSELLRCVAGNPFRAAALEAWVLRWREGTVSHLARAIYDDRSFGDLPVLADALEEAGCADASVLDHCRRKYEHARGCWVLDLLLARG